MTDWPLVVDDAGGEAEYYPIPESWIERGEDLEQGSPRLYAVSVGHSVRNIIAIRYHDPRQPKVLRVTMSSTPNPTGDGVVPALLAKDHLKWPRSLVARSDPTDRRRGPEAEHLRVLWAGRVEDVPSRAEAAPDGGRVITAMGDPLQTHLSRGGRSD